MTMARGDDARWPRGGPSQLQHAWEKMAGGAPVMVDVLMDVATSSDNPNARVGAATAVLKMLGFGQDEVKVRIVPAEFDQGAGAADGKVSQTKAIKARMDKLKAATAASMAPDDEVVDAILVEEQTD